MLFLELFGFLYYGAKSENKGSIEEQVVEVSPAKTDFRNCCKQSGIVFKIAYYLTSSSLESFVVVSI